MYKYGISCISFMPSLQEFTRKIGNAYSLNTQTEKLDILVQLVKEIGKLARFNQRSLGREPSAHEIDNIVRDIVIAGFKTARIYNVNLDVAIGDWIKSKGEPEESERMFGTKTTEHTEPKLNPFVQELPNPLIDE